MIKNLLAALLCLGILQATAQNKKASLTGGVPRPKLVVGIVVDQMRWDYLYRYFERYGNGGFKRLLNDGFSCENTLINYIPTVTAIGHSSIYSGSVPAISGIAGNEYIVQATGKSMESVDDSTEQTVGSTSAEGRMSPRNLLVTTVTDELKLATNFRSKVIGIALKDRGSILPAGHLANGAYWYDDITGNWITSTYYMKELPAWVKSFNDQRLAEKYMKQDWNTLYPVSTYLQSSPDDNPYEGKFKDAASPTFPIKTSTLMSPGFGAVRTSPYGNTLTLDLATAAIDNESLGKNTVTDFLAVSLSSTDYIGHFLGPNAVEMEDIYLRLDRDLETFFNHLDKSVGKGNYTVFLSADHGAAHNPIFLTDQNVPAGFWPSASVLSGLNAKLEAKYNVKRLALSLGNYQVNLNNAAIAAGKLDDAAIRADCVSYLKTREGVAFVIDMKDITTANVPEELRTRIVNGYNAERSGVIQIILKPGWLSGAGKTGTSHGTWNPYDTHIPLVFMGWGIHHGATNAATSITDIAPTLAALLHIQMPNGCIGKPIVEVLR